jgi:tetratricopeptide (TPR) repeat protein
VGRYHDASTANEKAAAADESYITQCRAQGFYPAAYYPHNVHFLYASSAFEGRSAVSIGAASKLSSNMTPEIVAAVPISEEFVPMELFALARFGRWAEITAMPAPIPEWRYATGVWHYARGLADAARGESEAALESLKTLRAVAAEPALSELVFASGSTPAQLLDIGAHVLEARIAGESGDWAASIPLLQQAVALQDALPYTEPPPWYFPVREALGYALLRADRAVEAEAVYRRQLQYTPRNGWSIYGLAESQRAQGLGEDAARSDEELREVWARADITLASSSF